MDALVLTIDMLRRLAAPSNRQVAVTGSYVEIAAAGDAANLIAPDGTARTLAANQWGQVRFLPLMAGRYHLIDGGTETEVLANYYDANESDLESEAELCGESTTAKPAAARSGGLEVRPFTLPLIALALLALLAESLMLARRARNWGMSHV